MKEQSGLPAKLRKTLRFPWVGCISLKDGETQAWRLDFDPLTERQMREEIDFALEDSETLLGFVAFNADDSFAYQWISVGTSEEQQKWIQDQLVEEFLPEDKVRFEVVLDPKLGPCQVVPLKDGGFVLMPIAGSVN